MVGPISLTFNKECYDAVKSAPDNHWDLAIIDPPYGIGEDGSRNHSRGGRTGFDGKRRSKVIPATKYKPFAGNDKEPPSPEYFTEIRRVSKNQIIWGANHFISRLPFDSPAWIVWDKDNGGNDFADCELAWTSFTCAVRKFKFKWNGMLQQDMANKELRIHPTQKPVALYKWLLTNYAKPGDRIIDPFLGSGSSRIAAYDMGFDFWGYELDADYFAAMEARFQAHISKPVLFAPEQMYRFEQAELFTPENLETR